MSSMLAKIAYAKARMQGFDVNGILDAQIEQAKTTLYARVEALSQTLLSNQQKVQEASKELMDTIATFPELAHAQARVDQLRQTVTSLRERQTHLTQGREQTHCALAAQTQGRQELIPMLQNLQRTLNSTQVSVHNQGVVNHTRQLGSRACTVIGRK